MKKTITAIALLMFGVRVSAMENHPDTGWYKFDGKYAIEIKGSKEKEETARFLEMQDKVILAGIKATRELQELAFEYTDVLSVRDEAPVFEVVLTTIAKKTRDI